MLAARENKILFCLNSGNVRKLSFLLRLKKSMKEVGTCGDVDFVSFIRARAADTDTPSNSCRQKPLKCAKHEAFKRGLVVKIRLF